MIYLNKLIKPFLPYLGAVLALVALWSIMFGIFGGTPINFYWPR